MLRSFYLTSLAVVLALFVGQAHATYFDLAADWSTTSNPNGAWSYKYVDDRGNVNDLGTFANLPVNQAFTPANGELAWQMGDDATPAIYKSTGLGSFDLPVGKIGGYPANPDPNDTNRTAALIWTSPGVGTVDLIGGTWMQRDHAQYRRNEVRIEKNNAELFPYFTLIPRQAEGTNSSNPFTFAAAAVAGGGLAGDVSDISVSTGDQIRLIVRRLESGDGNDFFGVNFAVDFTPIPEPGTLVLLATGLVGLLAYAWRKRK